MPATQKELDVVDVFDPLSNIQGGTLYLSRLLNQFDQDVELAAAAYNAGEGAVRESITDNLGTLNWRNRPEGDLLIGQKMKPERWRTFVLFENAL